MHEVESIPTPETPTSVNRVWLDRTRRQVVSSPDETRARRTVGIGLFVGDFAVSVIPLILRDGGLSTLRQPEMIYSVTAFVAVNWLCVYVAGGYRRRTIIQAAHIRAFFLSGVLGAVFALMAYKACRAFVGDGAQIYRFTAVTAIAPLAFGIWVAGSRAFTRGLMRRTEASARILVLGSGQGVSDLRQVVTQRLPHTPLVVFDNQANPSEGILPFSEFDAQLHGAVRTIILDLPLDSLPNHLLEDLVHARLLDIPIRRPSAFVEDLLERTPIAIGDPSWMLDDQDINPGRSVFYYSVKRILDLIAAVIGIILTAPIMLGVAIAVKLTSPGPVFFTQVRDGRWRKPFTIIKFRTMRTDAEKDGAQWAQKNDPRVTSIGAFLRKSRLDELPQFFNVLVGDMSLVGPRPERPEFNSKLIAQIPWYDLRHLIKPGLTGWAQVCYPYGASVEDAVAKLEYEVYYLKRASLRFDLRIIFRTISTVLGLRGR